MTPLVAPERRTLTWQDYEADLEFRLVDLQARVQREHIGRCHRDDGTYRSRMAGSALSPLKPVPGAAQPNPMCERHWTLPRDARRNTGSVRALSDL